MCGGMNPKRASCRPFRNAGKTGKVNLNRNRYNESTNNNKKCKCGKANIVHKRTNVPRAC